MNPNTQYMETLKTLLDRIYELEGLVQLALSRNDDATIRIAELISAKGEAVSRALAAYEESVTPSDAPEGPNPLAEAEDLIAYSLEEEEEETASKESHLTDSELNKEHEEVEKSDAEAQAEAAEMEEAEDAEPGENSEPVEVTDSSLAVETVDEEETPVADASEEEDEAHDEEEEERRVSDNLGAIESEEAPVSDTASRRLRSLFSINDRFRFSRELFGGSTKRFDDSLAYLDSAIDFNEVEDFFFDQGMDPESPVVQEFLDILARSFGD